MEDQDHAAGPQDRLGTVRAGDGLLAVRAHSPNPDYADDLVWYVIAIGADECPANVEHQLADWPIVYLPAQHANLLA